MREIQLRLFKFFSVGVLKKLLGVFTCFLIISITYVAVYLFFTFQNYKQEFYNQQTSEIQILSQKESKIIKNLKHLRSFTAQRIMVSKNDPQRIQHILNSLHTLSPHFKVPDIQKAVFIKLTDPVKRITRFGTVPLIGSISHLENTEDIIVEKSLLILHKPLLNTREALEGYLQVEINMESFKKSLGVYPTLTFSISSPTKTKGTFLDIYKIQPDSFKKFLLTHWHTYQIFLFYILASLIFMTGAFFYLRFSFQQKYHAQIMRMNAKLLDRAGQLNNFESQLTKSQQQLKAHQSSYQAQNLFWKDIVNNETYKNDYLHRALSFISQSVANDFDNREQLEILQSCLLLTESTRTSVAPQSEKENLYIKDLLENVQVIFASEIDKNNINFQIDDPTNASVQAHPLIMKFIFVNIVGKRLYQLPQGGHIFIEIQSNQQSIQVNMNDNAFSLSPKQEELIDRKNLFFIGQAPLEKLLCQNNCQCTQEQNNQHTRLTLENQPYVGEERSNVVPLFK